MNSQESRTVQGESCGYTCTTREQLHDDLPHPAVQVFPGRATVPGTAPPTRPAFHRPTPATPSYSQHMARVGGRNLAFSWLVGILCAGVVGALLWFAFPAGPAVVEVIGNSLRQLAP